MKKDFSRPIGGPGGAIIGQDASRLSGICKGEPEGPLKK